jgi:hypothetical protein
MALLVDERSLHCPCDSATRVHGILAPQRRLAAGSPPAINRVETSSSVRVAQSHCTAHFHNAFRRESVLTICIREARFTKPVYKEKEKVYTGFATGVDNGRQPASKGRPSRLMWRGAAPPKGRAKLRRPLEGLVDMMTVQLTSTHNQAVRVIDRHVDPSTCNVRDSRCGNPNGCHSRKRNFIDRAGNSKSNSVIFSTPTHVLQ